MFCEKGVLRNFAKFTGKHSCQSLFFNKVADPLASKRVVYFGLLRSSRPEVFCREGVLRNFAKFTGKHLCESLFFNKIAGLGKKETLTQVFFCEFCEISKNTFFYRTPLVAASVCSSLFCISRGKNSK